MTYWGWGGMLTSSSRAALGHGSHSTSLICMAETRRHEWSSTFQSDSHGTDSRPPFESPLLITAPHWPKCELYLISHAAAWYLLLGAQLSHSPCYRATSHEVVSATCTHTCHSLLRKQLWVLFCYCFVVSSLSIIGLHTALSEVSSFLGFCPHQIQHIFLEFQWINTRDQNW